jgi:hypothetical protein
MRRPVRSLAVMILLGLVLLAVPANTLAQACLGIDACLLSPTRADAGTPTSVNGCSVPPDAGALGLFWGTVFESACNQHDVDWGTFTSDVAGWFLQSNFAFRDAMRAICIARPALGPTCAQAAEIFFLAVSTTPIAMEIYRRGQYFASSCACRQLPTAPSSLTAQVSSTAAGSVVNLQWTPGADATSYRVEVVQPLLAAFDSGSPQPRFTAAAVPVGQYRVQVRAANPLGVSAPSNVLDVIVGSGGPCAIPSAPSLPTASLVGGAGTVTWPAVVGATSYIVIAGSEPGRSDLFNGHVGNVTSVTATGLPAGFRAYVRVYAVNACGTSGASAEVVVS